MPQIFYAVAQGRCPGVYESWSECKSQVHGHKPSLFKKFASREEAEEFCKGGCVSLQRPIHADLNSILYSDAGYNRQTKPDAWGSVVDGHGVDVLPKFTHLLTDMVLKKVVLPVGERLIIVAWADDVATQQNNYGELLALVAACRIGLGAHSPTKSILTDSSLLYNYWSKNHIDKKTRLTLDAKKLTFIEELVQLRQQFESRGGAIHKVSGAENLADLGYHVGA